MQSIGWKRRLVLFAQRLWQPTCACMTCMPGSLSMVGSLAHWITAAETGLTTGLLALLLTFTPAARLYHSRWGNAALVVALTMFGDLWSHAHRDGVRPLEVMRTGVVAGLLALAASYVLEDRGRRIRAAWARLRR
ncbi:hypothetical protein [Scleromatobacter humisilvae]|uniref:Uncharacterized protein n=1 Tax=Scleromatobacter humisilvae TaxID=2897159 RepID=A0A9X1YGX6_9BURK|nr:hypothetical protein [Scleromatobacter humisilvae]MCK9685215.1 hypothetical protein [Scleromatobacter humisilvae]